MNSEVQRNQKLILEGDVLFYTDNSNSQKWVVQSLFKGGFVAFSIDVEQDDVFFFNELQLGWEISEATKKKNTGERHFRYV